MKIALMKFIALLFLLPLFLVGCASHHSDSAQARFSDTAERQQASADNQKDEYEDCIDSINDKTAVENYADKNTRREVVLESCREEITRFTILQEQSYNNACRASGKNLMACDNEAVNKAKRDTDMLLQKASEYVNHTTAAHHSYRQ